MKVGSPIKQKVSRADDSKLGGAEHERVPKDPKNNGGNTKIHHIFNGYVDAVFCSNHPRLQAGESGLHQQDQGRTGQDPMQGWISGQFGHDGLVVTERLGVDPGIEQSECMKESSSWVICRTGSRLRPCA